MAGSETTRECASQVASFHPNTGGVGTQPPPPPPHIAELQDLFDALDASEVLAELRGYRRRAYGWRDAGRRGYGPEPLWLAYVASFHLNLDSTNDLVRRLEEDESLRHLCGFGDVLPHRTTFNRFITRLKNHSEATESCIAGVTEKLKVHHPDLGREVAVDSTIIRAYGNRHLETDADATWTKKPDPDTGKKKWYYGFKLHLLVDSRHEIPIALTFTTAKRSDFRELQPLVKKAEARHSWFKPYALTADKGYDAKAIHEFLYDRGILPIIAIRDTSTPESRGIFTRDGIPTCYGGKAMKHVATNGAGHRLYRCPKRGCHLKNSLRGGMKHCDTLYWLNPREENLRLCGAIERTSQEWKELYRQRQGVERVYKSAKKDVRLDRHNRMGLAAVGLHARMSILVYQARYLAETLAKEQAQAGEQTATEQRAGRPWMVRKVA